MRDGTTAAHATDPREISRLHSTQAGPRGEPAARATSQSSFQTRRFTPALPPSRARNMHMCTTAESTRGKRLPRGPARRASVSPPPPPLSSRAQTREPSGPLQGARGRRVSDAAATHGHMTYTINHRPRCPREPDARVRLDSARVLRRAPRPSLPVQFLGRGRRGQGHGCERGASAGCGGSDRNGGVSPRLRELSQNEGMGDSHRDLARMARRKGRGCQCPTPHTGRARARR